MSCHVQVIEGGNNKKQKPAYGADVLRLWVSSVDYSGDVCVGDNIIKQVRRRFGTRERETPRVTWKSLRLIAFDFFLPFVQFCEKQILPSVSCKLTFTLARPVRRPARKPLQSQTKACPSLERGVLMLIFVTSIDRSPPHTSLHHGTPPCIVSTRLTRHGRCRSLTGSSEILSGTCPGACSTSTPRRTACPTRTSLLSTSEGRARISWGLRREGGREG